MKKNKTTFNQLFHLTTEQRNHRSDHIDMLSTDKILAIINREDQIVARAVKKELPYIAKAVDIVIGSFKRGGRLLYIGAGTSGRLGVLDAAECPPTFGVDHTMVSAIIAGGKKAVFRSQEGTEDRKRDGARDLAALQPTNVDVVCGIAASMRTPYVIGALNEACRCDAKVILVTTNPRSNFRKPEFKALRNILDVAICPVVGPEVIMGSTRMKSGTAQKMVLNMLSTAAMIRIGKVYGNMMVDLEMNSAKLEERAKRVVMIATGVDYTTACDILGRAGGHVKTAIVMIKGRVSAAQARARLKRTNGFVRLAIGSNISHS